MKKILLIFLLVIIGGITFANDFKNEKVKILENKQLLFSQNDNFIKLMQNNNIAITLTADNIITKKLSSIISQENLIMPIENNVNSSIQILSRDSGSIYQYGNYVQDDLVGTSGNGIREQLMVATPVDKNFCLRPNVGEPLKELEEGILFVSSDTYRDNMYTKEAPLKMFHFRNVFSSGPIDLNIKNELPYSNNYSTPSNVYFIYYHNYLPLELVVDTIHTNGAGFAVGNTTESTIIGCYNLKYDGVDNRINRFYWLSLHKNVIYKDVLYILRTRHLLNIENFHNKTLNEENTIINTFIHLLRQGIDTNWYPTLQQLFGI